MKDPRAPQAPKPSKIPSPADVRLVIGTIALSMVAVGVALWSIPAALMVVGGLLWIDNSVNTISDRIIDRVWPLPPPVRPEDDE